LEQAETSFHQDLNGDGTIGVPAGSGTVIESFGSTSLVQSGANYFMNPVAGGSGPELMYSGAPVTSGQFGAWTPIGAEQISGGYEVAFKNTSTGQFVIWNTDSAGNQTSSAGPYTSTNTTLEQAETSFHQDLNGDGTIGVRSAVVPTAQNNVTSGSPHDAFIFRPNLGAAAVDTQVTPGVDFDSSIPTGVSAIPSGVHELPHVLPDASHTELHAIDLLHSFIIS
jgi:serralysin